MDIKHEEWIREQALAAVSQWDVELSSAYPEDSNWMNNPDLYFDHIMNKCNYLDAIKLVNWDRYIIPESTVLDVGCGAGWLSSFLSSMLHVNKIYSIDSSLNYTKYFLPSVVKSMGGVPNKIITVQGLFSPVLLNDESVDVIVISSAMHHSNNMSVLLNEFKRVLKRDGYLIILNETPASQIRFLAQITKAFFCIIYNTISRNFRANSQRIYSSGMLYDPALGDNDYPFWYWMKSIENSGFDVTVQKTHLSTLKYEKGRELIHFICKKIG